MKQTVHLVLALIAGFVGGVLSLFIVRPGNPTQVQHTVRARQFELLNEKGNMISFWGVDKWHQVVLAFGTEKPLPSGALEHISNQRASIGLDGNGSGMLHLNAPDGSPRVRLLINEFQQPTLVMDDETGARMGLGFLQTYTPGIHSDDWGLTFDHDDMAFFGVTHTRKSVKRGVLFLNGERVLTGPAR